MLPAAAPSGDIVMITSGRIMRIRRT